jgi:DNA replication regulator DPB11
MRRMQINNLLVANEGTYLKNLERPVKVTHLLCSGDEETEKMCYAENLNSRGEAKIHLVWEEWFWDSLDFGGHFDEAKYQVRKPRPERKTVGEGISISSLRLYYQVLSILNNQVLSSPPPPSSDLPSQHGGPTPVTKSNQPQNSTFDEIEDEKVFANVLPDATLLPRSARIPDHRTGGKVLSLPSGVFRQLFKQKIEVHRDNCRSDGRLRPQPVPVLLQVVVKLLR